MEFREEERAERKEQQKKIIEDLIATAEANVRVASDELAMYKNRVEVLKQVLEELEGA